MQEDIDRDPDSHENEDCDALPSTFQKRTLWTAITAVALVVIATIAVGAILLGGKVLGFLQPLLVPIAIAAILAYLLQPIVIWLRVKTRLPYKASMLIVFITFLAALVSLAVAVIIPTLGQAQEIVRDWDVIQVKITDAATKALDDVQQRFDNPVAQKYTREYYDKGVAWLSEEGPKLGQKIGPKLGDWTWETAKEMFTFLGYLLGLILVPLYLFFFLKESHVIKKTWSDYIPLRASKFKDELVDTLQEINQYLISFFRGQMVVSLIDGALVAMALSLILDLPYALLIGVFLAILGLIPYIGNLLVMIPAVLIAIVHFNEKAVVPYDLSSDIKPNEVYLVDVPNDGTTAKKKRYVTAVKNVSIVKVLEDDKLVEAYIPYVEPASAGDSTDNRAEAEPQGEETLIPVVPVVGKVMDVTLENGLVKAREIQEVLGSEKRAVVLKNGWSFMPNVWLYPLIVIAIFVVLQQINGLVTAPLIVGDSVGLHPLTVILSVLFWSFLLGGLLGALLAVPLTASVKVLFRRYIWSSRINPDDDSNQPKGGDESEPAKASA